MATMIEFKRPDGQSIQGHLSEPANPAMALGPKRLPITQYDPAWGQIAWDRTFAFFGRHLG